MDYNRIFYQIYPLGFCGAPKANDGNTVNRIRRMKEWIPHLKKLGITDVYFSPVFESDRHGYDTRDYAKIDCRLGTNEDFRDVCDALHDNGIRVVLDGVFNHVGRGFWAFRDVQEKKWDSPYKDWFHINFNDTWGKDGFTYRNWEGHDELIALNLYNPEVKKYLLDRVDQWISEFDIDGLRLDVAYMVERNFLRELSDHVKQIDPDFFLLGEMIGGDYNVLLKDAKLDSVTNYECRKGIYSSMNSSNLFEIGYSLNRQFGHDPWCLYTDRHLLSFADNHDVDRIASVLENEKDLPLVYDLLFAMPGMPCIYYGSEWGAKGSRSKFSDSNLRPEYKKPQWNELTDHIARLCEMRRRYSVFTDGDYFQQYIQNKQLIFRRRNSKGQLTFALNIADEAHHANFSAEVTDAIDIFSHKKQNFSEGLDMDPKSACFFYSDWL